MQMRRMYAILKHIVSGAFLEKEDKMAEKRKDKRGRVLKTGESERADGTYQYRYKDVREKVRYVYAPTLDALRGKEDTIQRDLADGIDYAAGEVTLKELVRCYVAQKQGGRYSTKVNYNFVSNGVQGATSGIKKQVV